MFKDEAGGEQIAEFVGLRAKLYSYRMDKGTEEKKCKGIKKAVVKKTISFNDYKNCLFNKKPQMRQMNVIRSHKHEVFTETVNKVALSCEDDKRIIMSRWYQHLRLRSFPNKFMISYVLCIRLWENLESDISKIYNLSFIRR